jgi:hypothetical protein
MTLHFRNDYLPPRRKQGNDAPGSWEYSCTIRAIAQGVYLHRELMAENAYKEISLHKLSHLRFLIDARHC